MEEYPLTQSSWGRARQDTLSVFHTIRFWVVEMISAPIVALGMYLAIPNSASTVIKAIVPLAAFSIWMLAVLGGVFLLSLLVAPYRQRNEARQRVVALEQERIPRITVNPYGARRQWDFEHEHLMWAELQVSNTSHSLTLNDVEVRVVSCVHVVEKQDAPDNYVLVDLHDWNPTGVYWSERDASPSQLRLSIPPNTTRRALIAFQDNSNGTTTIFNAPVVPKPIIVDGAKIEIEVSSPESAPWKGAFYIRCHPNYWRGPQATFEFVTWEVWIANHNVANSSAIDEESNHP